MDLITTHMNADFDALGSIVAAKKLYPDSRLLLPGSQERAVREFLSLAKDEVVVENERECRLDDIDRLIIVDTRHRSRIGIASGLLDKGVEVHVYDHHPRMKGDIVADKDISEEVGATVTMLADILKRRGVRLSGLEATIMLLGIYEETGSLTYKSTTKLDVDMVSFLLSQGASLSTVSGYLNRELSEGELSMLTKLIAGTKRLTIKGVNISFIEIDSESYVDELGLILQKLAEIENIPVLFVIINTRRGKIDVIGRSSLPSVDVNKILSHLGGGGHPGAACAKISSSDANSVKDNLIKVLNDNIRVDIHARDIMSTNIRMLSVNDDIDYAREALKTNRLGGMPVVDRGRIVGIVTPECLNKAVKGGYGHSRVKGYMSRDVATVKMDTPLYSIRKMMSERHLAVIPVVSRKKMVGVINRDDVLRNIHDNLFLKQPVVKKQVIVNMSKKMRELLPSDIISLLKRIGRIANSLDYNAFIVGGLVRDLILGVKNLDLDIVVEGSAIKLGNELARSLKGSLVIHRRFGTCSVVTRDRLKIDMATARKEIYERPAALPTVEFSSLKEDLLRRDFTINAMAISLNRANFGQMADFFGGEEDLGRGRIRVMHEASFIDDPTRIFRAVRFEQRLGFVIDRHTEELIRHAIKIEMFDKVEPQRIRDEIVLILKEREPLKAVKRMAELDELRFLHARIKWSKRMVSLFNSIERATAWYDKSDFKKRSIDIWLIYFMALLDGLDYKQTAGVVNRFVFRRGEAIRILSYKRNAARVIRAFTAEGKVAPSRIHDILEPLSFEVILLIMAKTDSPRVRSRIKDFFQRYNGVRVRIKGDDLKAMGAVPGPVFKKILKKTLDARIDGRLKTKEDEIVYAARMMRGYL